MCRKATSKLVLFCQLLISLDISLWKGAQGHREREREVGRMEGEEEERREDKSSPVNKAAWRAPPPRCSTSCTPDLWKQPETTWTRNSHINFTAKVFNTEKVTSEGTFKLRSWARSHFLIGNSAITSQRAFYESCCRGDLHPHWVSTPMRLQQMSAARANASLQLPSRHLGAAGRASGGEADNSLMKRGKVWKSHLQRRGLQSLRGR